MIQKLQLTAEQNKNQWVDHIIALVLVYASLFAGPL